MTLGNPLMDSSSGPGDEGTPSAPRNMSSSHDWDPFFPAEALERDGGPFRHDLETSETDIPFGSQLPPQPWSHLTLPSIPEDDNAVNNFQFNPMDYEAWPLPEPHPYEYTTPDHTQGFREGFSSSSVYGTNDFEDQIEGTGSSSSSLSCWRFKTLTLDTESTSYTSHSTPVNALSSSYNSPTPLHDDVNHLEHLPFEETDDEARQGMKDTLRKGKIATKNQKPTTVQSTTKAQKPTKGTSLDLTSRATSSFIAADDLLSGPSTKGKFTVRTIDGEMQVLLSRNDWASAIYHDQIRAQLVVLAPPNGPDGYVHEPASGKDKLDVTTYYEPHKDWGFNSRGNRPDVCFQWVARSNTTLPTPKFEFMMHGGAIVLDRLTDRAIQDLPMPSCISSQVEGGRLEAMVRLHGRQVITNGQWISNLFPSDTQSRIP
ncbi:MAG: hypothetical protein Q9169_005471 [Polycauliona sp. 2 TL-2023]